MKLPEDVAGQAYDATLKGFQKDGALDMEGVRNVLKLRAQFEGGAPADPGQVSRSELLSEGACRDVRPPEREKADGRVHRYPAFSSKKPAPRPMPIEGVPTSTTAFVGRTWRGPIDVPVRITSFAEYEREFGGLWRESTLGFAIKQFFENGGADALVVRVATRAGASAAKTAAISLKNGETFHAVNPGSWGLNLKITIDHQGLDPAQDTLFNLTVTDDAETKRDSAERGGSGDIERYFLLSADPANPNFVGRRLREAIAAGAAGIRTAGDIACG